MQCGEFGRRDTHHCPAVGIEAQCGNHRQTHIARAGDRRLGLLDGRHGLDPQNIRATLRESDCLFGKGILGGTQAQRSERRENLPGRSNAAADQHHPPGAIGRAAGDACRQRVQLRYPMFRLVQLQPMTRAAEAVGQDNVRAGLHERLLQLRYPLGMRGVPQLRCVARLQAAVE